MSTKLNARWFRSGRVLSNPTPGAPYLILLDTPGPGEWYAMDHTGRVTRIRASLIATLYENLHTTVAGLPRNSEVKASLETVRDALISLTSTPTTRISAARLSSITRQVSAEFARRNRGEAAAAVASVASEPAPSSGRRASSKFSVAPYDPDSYWYESDDDAAVLEDFIELRKQNHPINMLIAGPSGSGKTEGILRKGKALGIPVHIVNCQAITTPEKWIGQMQADTERGTYFVPSQHIQWVERTHEDCEGFEFCIILYDEITRLRAELNNMTYSLFDTQRGLEVPQMGRRVVMAQENMVIATANIGSAFTGTHTQDRAFRERFSVTMERGFPPMNSEVKILTSATRIDEIQAQELVRVADQTRKLWATEEIDSPISTRTLKAWALFVAGGYSVKKAAEYTVIPLYSNDGGLSSDRTKVASMIEGKVR